MDSESLATNPFMTVLCSSFEKIYKAMLDKQAVLLVPQASSLVGIQISQVLVETHILLHTHIPNNFLNLIGQGVEFRDGCIHTSFGFKEQRICSVLHEENMYDQANSFRVLCIDRPLHGRFDGKASLGSVQLAELEQPSLFTSFDAETVKTTAKRFLESLPTQEKLERFVEKFSTSYIFVPGLEQDAAIRIYQICNTMVDAVRQSRFLHTKDSPQINYLINIFHRYVYLKLYSSIWAHLITSLAPKEAVLQREIRLLRKRPSFAAEMLQATTLSQQFNFGALSSKLEDLDCLHTPHEKLGCLKEIQQLLYRVATEESLKSIQSSNLLVVARKPVVEISGDELLSVFIVILVKSRITHILAHLLHMEMLMSQKSPQRPDESEVYTYTAFHSAVFYCMKGHQETHRQRLKDKPSTAFP